jgi:ABC-type multidrug transport system fused ATPase/permease subunit
VQEHVGTLPVAYYDANKSGALVSRIMSDVEGVRNLIGTGLVEFAGGMLEGAAGLGVPAAHQRPDDGFALLFVVDFRRSCSAGLHQDPADFPRARQDQRGSQGRLTESLGGVRVVKGYHAEAREADVFSGGVQRLLDNVLKSLTAMSLMSLSATC